MTAIPGVASAAFASEMPMEGIEPNWDNVFIEGKTYDPAQIPPPLRLFQYVSPGLFRTAGMRLVAGRELTWTEVYGHRPVACFPRILLASCGARRLRPSVSGSASFRECRGSR